MIKAREISGLVLTETLHPQSMSLPMHSHESVNFVCVLSGSFLDTSGNRSQSCSPLTLITRPADVVHSNMYGPTGARSLIVEFVDQRWHSIEAFSRCFKKLEYFRGGLQSGLIPRIYHEFHSTDSITEVAIEGMMLELIAHTARMEFTSITQGRPPWLNRVREYLHESYLSPVRLLELAESFDVHPSHLTKSFRKHFGCTPGEYLRRLRLDYAAEQLLRADITIADISLAAGFYDQSHFTNAFKSHTGLTPLEFRRSTRLWKPVTKKL